MMFYLFGKKWKILVLNPIHIEKPSNVKGKTAFRITTEPTILGSKNETSWPRFLCHLSRPPAEGCVHHPSVSSVPRVNNNTNSKHAFCQG